MIVKKLPYTDGKVNDPPTKKTAMFTVWNFTGRIIAIIVQVRYNKSSATGFSVMPKSLLF